MPPVADLVRNRSDEPCAPCVHGGAVTGGDATAPAAPPAAAQPPAEGHSVGYWIFMSIVVLFVIYLLYAAFAMYLFVSAATDIGNALADHSAAGQTAAPAAQSADSAAAHGSAARAWSGW